MNKRYVQVRFPEMSLSMDECKRDIERMSQTIEECRFALMVKYNKVYNGLASYFEKVLGVFEVAKITCECVLSELQERRKGDYIYHYWYQRMQQENVQLRLQVNSVIEEQKAEHFIQTERMKKELENVEAALRKEHKSSSKLRAQLHYERHMFGNDYVVQAHDRARVAEKQNVDLRNELDQCRNREAEMNAWLDNIIHNRNGLLTERERDKSAIRTLQEQIRELSEASVDNGEQKGLEAQLEKAKRDLDETQRELKEVKNRLSALMGQKLTDNNPNITDLSDKNRPTKLAERYTELYDNQWTDAFQTIDNGKEQESITTLKEILLDTMRFCRAEADVQLKELKKTLTGGFDAFTVPDQVNKQLKECRKLLAEVSGKQMFQKYKETLGRSKSNTATTALRVRAYLEECFQLCWLMSVQDPPVVLGPDLNYGCAFQTQIFRSYTQSGPHIDYIVWPALYLHEGGALLSKGVAQGCDIVTQKTG